MSQTITCPNCKESIEISKAITGEIADRIIREHEQKHKYEISRLLQEKESLVEESNKKLAELKITLEKDMKAEILDKVQQEYTLKIESIQADASLQEKQNKELREQLTELLKQNREMKTRDEVREIEYQKKLIEEQDLIKIRAKQEVLEQTQLRMAQKDKQLDDLRKQLNEAQRKAEQGSQQTQGEVQETFLEDLLKAEFPYDEIKEVPKGVEGADVIQIVKTNYGTVCGTIVWESKNTKAWSQSWVTKLKADQRMLKAEVAVIVSKILPENIRLFGNIEGVWVADLSVSLGIATVLRQQIIQIFNAKLVTANMSSKAEIVYDYLTSNNFKQRIEVWVEYFKQRREEIDKERAYFIKKWEKEDKSILQIFNNTAGIYGDLQGLIGSALPKVSYLELDNKPESEEELNTENPKQETLL